MKKIILLLSFIVQPLHAFDMPLHYGGHSMVAPLKDVVVRAPDQAFSAADPQKWHYTAQPDLEKARAEHQKIVQILEGEGVKVHYHKAALPHHADALFVHDPLFMTDYGAIVLRMGKELRRGEEAALRDTIKAMNIPVFLELSGKATAEGGDMLWVDQKTLAIGRGYRTNQEGIDQIQKALKPKGVQVVQVDLPCDQGAEACLHLQSLISFVDHKKAVVYQKFMPVSFLETLKNKGIEVLEVPEDEYASMATNILAIKPNVLLMLEDNTQTINMLKTAGCKVYTYQGAEISHKAEGGATCLTRPILRRLT